MSFSFSAVGTKEEVAAQLGAANITAGEDRFNLVALDLRDLLVKHFEAEAAAAWNGGEYRYTVEASGHGGGTLPVSLQVTVKPHWITVPAPADAAPDTDED